MVDVYEITKVAWLIPKDDPERKILIDRHYTTNILTEEELAKEKETDGSALILSSEIAEVLDGDTLRGQSHVGKFLRRELKLARYFFGKRKGELKGFYFLYDDYYPFTCRKFEDYTIQYEKKTEKTKVSFERMTSFDSDKVIQYCVERGMSII